MFWNNIVIQKLSDSLVSSLAIAFSEWPKPRTLFEEYYNQQKEGGREVWVALKKNNPVGYVTLMGVSDFQYFRNKGIPEINDLNVLLSYRKQGIGSQLLYIAEKTAFEKSDIVGLGVGLYADYGAAQQLYVRKGYIPDGNGITYKNKSVVPGEKVIVNDELLLWLVKYKK